MANIKMTLQAFSLRFVAIFVLYLLLARLGLNYATVNGNGTILWLPSGLALVVMLLWGRQYWPGIFGGAFAAGLMAGDSVWLSMLIAAGNTLEPLLGKP